jgi:hypothetical protein
MPAAVGVENAEIARIFREYADLLELEEANPFRVRAYRNAARTIEEASEPVHEIVAENPLRLTELPGIGADLAGKICDIVETGTFEGFAAERRALPAGLPDLLRVRGLGPVCRGFLPSCGKTGAKSRPPGTDCCPASSRWATFAATCRCTPRIRTAGTSSRPWPKPPRRWATSTSR